MPSLHKISLTIFLIITTLISILSCSHLNTDARKPATTKTVSTTTWNNDLKPIVLIGNIPGVYLNKDKNKFYLGFIEINKNRVITMIDLLTTDQVKSFISKQSEEKIIINLQQPDSHHYDALYPGLFNLHNHTKQNVLPTWSAAKGQFQNRFEWCDWGNYKKSVSQNMNPWIEYGTAMNCAAFRWSHLQNMINGTIFLQGPSSCVKDFGIYRVEDKSAYVSKKAAVQAPTDLIYPLEMSYVWHVLKKDIDAGKSYEEALLNDIKLHCSGESIDKLNTENINTSVGLKIISNKNLLTSSCTKAPETMHPKFIRYVYRIHKTIAGKKEYLKPSNNPSAIIAHLAEGRRNDPYNQIEYQLIKLLGLNKPYVNFIHGVGLRGDGIFGNDPTDPHDKNDDYLDLAKNQMGLIWSPYSNLLLYGETLDIEAAHSAGVNLAIGSDWVPTGTKSVLEEIKLAANYVDRTYTRNKSSKLNKIFTDEYLYKMMTENPAKMINHWTESTTNKDEASAGRLAIGAMGSVIVVSIQHPNPYTNLVRTATEKQINLVVVDGKPIYGNINYLEQAGFAKDQYETFTNEAAIQDQAATEQIVNAGILKPMVEDLNIAKSDDEAVTNDEAETEISKKQENPFLTHLANDVRNYKEKMPRRDLCRFSTPKAFVTPQTKTFEAAVQKFENETQLDLDKIADIQLLLAITSLTQSINRLSKNADSKFAMNYFPNLYTCNDSEDKHSYRYRKYVRADGNDELQKNMEQVMRVSNRKGVPKTAETIAELYGLKFEVK